MENFRNIKDKVELKVVVGNIYLEVNKISQNEMNCTGLPTHNVLLSSQREVKQPDSWHYFNSCTRKASGGVCDF